MSGEQSGDLPKSGGYAGLQSFQALVNQYAALDGLVRQVIDGKAFAGLVKVTAVNGGGTSGPPTVDVQPMVNQVDGLGNQTPHGIVHGLPCFRLQAGNAAIIVDPIVGDIGDAVICDRDVSTVKSTKDQSGPGSFRTNSWADGCYFGSFLGSTAENYLEINSGGVKIETSGTCSINASGGVTITGGTTIDNKIFLLHEHIGVQTGGGITGPVS